VAWVERGRANLDFDALEARPTADAFYGVAATAKELSVATPVVLKRHRSA